MRPALLISSLAVLLLGAALFLPGNTLTGDAIGTCGEIGCTELCDTKDQCTSSGQTCCFTHWESGVCDLATNCETIREYSLYQSIETYQDTVREQPSPLDPGLFVIPLLVVAGALWFVLRQS